jgi:hypothetical protein
VDFAISRGVAFLTPKQCCESNGLAICNTAIDGFHEAVDVAMVGSQKKQQISRAQGRKPIDILIKSVICGSDLGDWIRKFLDPNMIQVPLGLQFGKQAAIGDLARDMDTARQAAPCGSPAQFQNLVIVVAATAFDVRHQKVQGPLLWGIVCH